MENEEKELEQSLSDELSDVRVEIENNKEEEKPLKCYNCGEECSGENWVRITEDGEDYLLAPVCDDCFKEVEEN